MAQKNLRDKHIFLVSTDSKNHSMVQNMLLSAGATWISMQNQPQRALSELSATRVSLILLGGSRESAQSLADFAYELRRSPESRNRATPMVAILDQPNRAMLETARDAGISEFLTLPLTPNVLRDRLLLAMSAQRPFTSAKNYVGPDRRRRQDGPPAGSERRHRVKSK